MRFLVFFFLSCSFALAQQYQFNALVFSATAGYRHASIEQGVTAIRELSEKHHFSYKWTENAAVFNQDLESKFDLIIFLNTSGEILNAEQQKFFRNFIENGGGFVGIHCATCTHQSWDWYIEMLGAKFKSHPYIQTASLEVKDAAHYATTHLPGHWLWTDEWYVFEQVNPDINVLLEVNEKSYDPTHSWEETTGMGDFHPISWYHTYDSARIFYTALGHKPEAYQDPDFLNHLLGGIYWVATGNVPAD